MKLVYKFVCGVSFVLSTMVTSSPAIAQQQKLSATADNFTRFTPEKMYNDVAKLTALTPLKYRNHPDFGSRLNDSINWYEQIDKRTLTTRTYSGQGRKIIIEKGYSNLNYIDAKGWMRNVNTKLKPSATGWSAEQQEIPVYIYHDASTALSIGNNQLMTFNKNVRFNQKKLSVNDYTVGDNGMYIKNVLPGIDKIIHTGRGRIETDYRIKQPIKLNGDLVVSEDIALPAGFTISEDTNYDTETDVPGALVVTGTDGKIVAELKAPFCYDNKGNSVSGNYQLKKQAGGYYLEIDVPSAWVSNPNREYPITIDPVANGPLALYSGGIIPSCVYPKFDTASIVVTIPGGITITHLYAQGEFYASPAYHIRIKNGFLSFQTSCLAHPLIYPGDSVKGNVDTSGWVYTSIFTNDITPYGTTFCYSPSCSAKTFRLIMGISRDTLDTAGCSSRYVLYDPSNTGNEPFEAYIVGDSVGVNYTTPSSVCSKQCTFNITINANFGVPPYTIIHPWGRDTTFGAYDLFNGISIGSIKYPVTVPNCHYISCHDSTLSVPPPLIIDNCNDTLKGLTAQILTLKGIPNVTATPDSQTICSGANVNISLKSCDTAATFTWTNSEGASGSGNPVTNSPSNNGNTKIDVTYTVTPVVSGCEGNATNFPVTVTPFNVIINPVNPAICDGGSVDLTVSGDGNSYSWSENKAWDIQGLNCTLCVSPVASPTTTTTYHVYGTNGNRGCSAIDSVVVVVNPLPDFLVSGDTTIFNGQSAQLSSQSSDSVTWSPATGLSCTDCDNPVATPLVSTYYLASSTEGSCTITKVVLVKVIEPCEAVHVPSAFTPDAEINNRLHVLNYGKVSLQVFKVYNRWGEQVFETNDITGVWDGKFDGKPEPTGTYFYYAVVNCQGGSIILRGNVTLIR